MPNKEGNNMAVKKAAAKKPATKRPAKKAATKRSAPTGGGVEVVDDDDMDTSLSVRGKIDVVSPKLNPIIEEMLAKGKSERQLKDGKPFTISQVRYWQPRGNALLPDGKRLRVSGGNGKNISIAIVDGVSKSPLVDAYRRGERPNRRKVEGAAPRSKAKKAAAKKSPAKRVRKPAKRKAA